MYHTLLKSYHSNLYLFDNVLTCSDNSCIVSFSINSEATSNTQVPVLISETISFPPRLSSDIALSILTVKLF